MFPSFNTRKSNPQCEIKKLKSQITKIRNECIKDACMLSELSFEVAVLRKKVQLKQTQGHQGEAVMAMQTQIARMQQERRRVEKASQEMERKNEVVIRGSHETKKWLQTMRYQRKPQPVSSRYCYVEQATSSLMNPSLQEGFCVQYASK
jgi:flagellar biosynthesis chaperone FliJ